MFLTTELVAGKPQTKLHNFLLLPLFSSALLLFFSFPHTDGQAAASNPAAKGPLFILLSFAFIFIWYRIKFKQLVNRQHFYPLYPLWEIPCSKSRSQSSEIRRRQSGWSGCRPRRRKTKRRLRSKCGSTSFHYLLVKRSAALTG